MMPNEQIIYNNTDISGIAGVKIPYYTAVNFPNREVNAHKLARNSLSIVTSAEYSDKAIIVNAYICRGDRHETEEAIDEVKAIIGKANGELKVRQSDGIYSYTTTLSNFEIDKWTNSAAWCIITFYASTPLGTSVNEETIVNASTSSSYQGFPVTIGGSANAEPLVTIQYSSITGGTGQSISITNGQTNQGITITGNFNSGDLIEIDSLSMTVTINGFNIDFSGMFPTFEVGSNQLDYSDTFSARTATITATYRRRII